MLRYVPRRAVAVGGSDGRAVRAFLKRRVVVGLGVSEFISVEGLTRNNRGRVIDVGRQFEKAVNAAGLIDFRFHDLRHTAATRMAETGADAFTLCAIFGWSDVRMALRYTHATNAATRRAVESLDGKAKVGNDLATRKKKAGRRQP